MSIKDIFDAVVNYKIPFGDILGVMIIAATCIGSVVFCFVLDRKDQPKK